VRTLRIFENKYAKSENNVMKLFKITSFAIVISIILAGCGSSTGSNGGNGGGNGDDTEYDLTTSASPSQAGSVNPSSGTFDEGSDVTVEARSADGWAFSDWTGDISSQDNPLTFTIDEDTDLTANFEDQRSMYTVEMFATNMQDTVKGLEIGQDENGSSGFDNGLDEDSPPPPPQGGLHGYFLVGNLELRKDFRNNIEKQVTWTFIYQVDTGQDLKLEWTIADNTQTPGSLTLTDKDDSFQVDMFSENTHTVSGSTQDTLLIEYSFN
jgi:hypothetical protein